MAFSRFPPPLKTVSLARRARPPLSLPCSRSQLAELASERLVFCEVKKESKSKSKSTMEERARALLAEGASRLVVWQRPSPSSSTSTSTSSSSSTKLLFSSFPSPTNDEEELRALERLFEDREGAIKSGIVLEGKRFEVKREERREKERGEKKEKKEKKNRFFSNKAHRKRGKKTTF